MEKKHSTQKLTGTKDLFLSSWNIYKKDFKKFLVIAVIFFGVTGLMMTFIGLKIPLTIPWYLFLFIILAAALISILGITSLISAVKEVPQEWKIRDVLKKGWSKYLSFLLVSLLTGLVVGLGFLFFIVPGIIFAIWFAFSYYTVICEDKRGFKALSRSKELVKGYWWPTAKRVFALIIISIPFSMGAQFIPYFGQFVYIILFTPFSIVYNYLIYQNLKEIKGGEG